MSNTITISFDPNNLADCEGVVDRIGSILQYHHGNAVMTEVFLAAIPTKRYLQKLANIELMIAYRRSQLSAKKFAKKFAEKNKSLPLDRRMAAAAQILRRSKNKYAAKRSACRRTSVTAILSSG